MRDPRLLLCRLAVAGLGLAACTPQVDPDPSADAGPVAERQSAAADLPPEVVEQLRSDYPVLGREPVPEPQPRLDADPRNVPARVSDAASERVLQSATGGATFYADSFEGKRTASGIPFRQNQMVAAHRSYPFGTLLRVTNADTERSVNVRVVDRGPFGPASHRHRTIIDLSRRAATQLGFVDAGRTRVRVEVLEWGEGLPHPG